MRGVTSPHPFMNPYQKYTYRFKHMVYFHSAFLFASMGIIAIVISSRPVLPFQCYLMFLIGTLILELQILLRACRSCKCPKMASSQYTVPLFVRNRMLFLDLCLALIIFHFVIGYGSSLMTFFLGLTMISFAIFYRKEEDQLQRLKDGLVDRICTMSPSESNKYLNLALKFEEFDLANKISILQHARIINDRPGEV